MEPEPPRNRVADFFIGIGAVIIWWILYAVLGSAIPALLGPMLAITAIAYIAGLAYSVVFNRPFIGFGILTTIVLPILVAGGCLLIYGLPN